jgi:ubiquinone/menaquinone biosynthesis C-methylase UbiE
MRFFEHRRPYKVLWMGSNTVVTDALVLSYLHTNIVDIAESAKRLQQKLAPLLKFEQADVEALHYDDASFDRILSTCLLHHLVDPEQGLLEMRRVVRRGGLISLTLPCDPGFLYRVGKVVGPYRRLRKNFGVSDPRYLHYIQHRNHFPALESIISQVFKNDNIKHRTYPFSLPFWNLNLFRIYQIRKS